MLDEHFAGFRAAIDAEIERARDEAIAEFLSAADRIRSSASEAERATILEKFGAIPGAVEFLRNLSPKASPQEEKHLRAQRFARVRVAEIQLYHAAAMRSGRASKNVYGSLKTHMDAARQAYRENFLTPTNGTADYLHAEFVRTLANDDAALLGPEYPGPLV